MSIEERIQKLIELACEDISREEFDRRLAELQGTL